MRTSFHIHLVSLKPCKKSLLLLNSPRLFLISPKSFPVYHTLYQVLSDTSSHIGTTYIILYPLASNVLYRLALVLKIEAMIETIPSCSEEEVRT